MNKSFLDHIIYQNTVLDWLFFLTYILAAFMLSRALYWLSTRVVRKALQKTKYRFDGLLLDLLEEPFSLLIILFGFSLANSQLNISDINQDNLDKFFKIAYVLNVTWFFSRLIVSLLKIYGQKIVKKDTNNLDEHILTITIKLCSILSWILGFLLAFKSAGFNVTTLLGGLGIGGIALAMAAKDFISNIFGGITIIIDKPFKIGERIKIKGYDGFVEDIGLRCSKLKTLEGRIITVPNSLFLGDMIENVTLEPSRKVVLTIGLVYSTSEEKMSEAVEKLKQIGRNSNHTEGSQTIVFFETFDASSMNIKFIYYIKKESDIMETQTIINLEIIRTFKQSDLEMAFPTRTIYYSNLDK